MKARSGRKLNGINNLASTDFHGKPVDAEKIRGNSRNKKNQHVDVVIHAFPSIPSFFLLKNQ
jgi:hypothetical protein